MGEEVYEIFQGEPHRGAGRDKIVRHALANELGYAPAELHLKARLNYLPAHNVLRARPGGAVAPKQLRPRRVLRRRVRRSAPQDRRGGAVREEGRRDETGLGAVPPLERQAAQLDPDEEHLLSRVDPGVVQGPGESPRPGCAAQAPDGYTPRMLREAEPRQQLGVYGWRREARGRDEEDRPDLRRVGAGLVQRAAGRLLREADGVLDVEDVLLGEGVILVEPLGRHAEAAAVYLYVVEDRQETLDVLVNPGEHGVCEVLGRPLGHAMFGHRGRHREDSWVRQRHLHAPSRSPAVLRLSSTRVSGTPKRFMMACPLSENIWRPKGFRVRGTWSRCMPSLFSSIFLSENLKYCR